MTRRGNSAAFEALVQRYQSRLLAFCRHMLGSTEDAEDVLQEVFTASYNAMLADDRAINARPWLYRIARNRCLNHLRRPTASGQDSMDVFERDGGTSTADTVHKREEFRQIVADVQDLPETQRTALLLREIDALSYEQISVAMETTVPSVKSLLVRARVSLAEAAEARLLSCDEVRLELGQVAEGLTRTTAPVRRHLKSCDRCRTFRTELRRANRALAAVYPIGAIASLKLFVSKLGIGAAAGGSSAGSGSSAAGGAGLASGAGAAAGTAGGTTAGGLLSAGVTGLATKAAAGLAAAAIVTAGAAEVKQATHKALSPETHAAATAAATRQPTTVPVLPNIAEEPLPIAPAEVTDTPAADTKATVAIAETAVPGAETVPPVATVPPTDVAPPAPPVESTEPTTPPEGAPPGETDPTDQQEEGTFTLPGPDDTNDNTDPGPSPPPGESDDAPPAGPDSTPAAGEPATAGSGSGSHSSDDSHHGPS
jgi:RNA polymerase sigma factor (sigma-70 family)